MPSDPRPAAPEPVAAPDPRLQAVDILIEDERWQAVDMALLRRAAEMAAATCGGTATLALNADAAVAALNGQFRGKPVATNVLSFPSGDPRMGLGDVIMAFETMHREAAEQGVPLSHHACHLAVHGILHLGGHDHDTNTRAALMEALETRLLAALGIADPYAEAETISLNEADSR